MGRYGAAMLLRALLNVSLVGSLSFARAEDKGWQHVWSDEFEGAKLDFAKWAVAENAHGGGNGELQFFVDRPENVRVTDGHLVIEARREEFEAIGQKRNFTSGQLRTKHRAEWKYGRVEVRAKLPAGRGIWPAIWMLPAQNRYGGWAASGEIDIMELVGHEPNTVHGTLHYGSKWPKNVRTGAPFVLPKGTFADDFHVFALEWEHGVVRWYVDGALYQTQTKWVSDGGSFPVPFDQPFYLILNVSVGGQWPGPPDAKTVFPQQMTVDYVRVYQRKP